MADRKHDSHGTLDDLADNLGEALGDLRGEALNFCGHCRFHFALTGPRYAGRGRSHKGGTGQERGDCATPGDAERKRRRAEARSAVAAREYASYSRWPFRVSPFGRAVAVVSLRTFIPINMADVRFPRSRFAPCRGQRASGGRPCLKFPPPDFGRAVRGAGASSILSSRRVDGSSFWQGLQCRASAPILLSIY